MPSVQYPWLMKTDTEEAPQKSLGWNPSTGLEMVICTNIKILGLRLGNLWLGDKIILRNIGVNRGGVWHMVIVMIGRRNVLFTFWVCNWFLSGDWIYDWERFGDWLLERDYLSEILPVTFCNCSGAVNAGSRGR